jgi:hypothetical protein
MLAAAPALFRARIERAAQQPVVLYWSYLREADSDVYAGPDRSKPGVETWLTLTVESIAADDRTMETCTGTMYVARATLRLTSADGMLDEAFEGELSTSVAGSISAVTGSTAVDFYADAGGLDPSASRLVEAVRSLGFDPAQVTRSLRITFAEDSVDGELNMFPPANVTDAELRLWKFARFGTDLPAAAEWQDVEPSPALEQACAPAQAASTQPRRITDPGLALSPDAQAAWLSAISGRWLLCAGSGTLVPDHAGIEIAPDGSWHHLVAQDDALVEARGIGHEGRIAFFITSAPVPGEVMVAFPGLAEPLSTCMFTVSSSADGAELSVRGSSVQFPELPATAIDYAYVAAPDVAVVPAEAAYQRGERAGVAACAEPEAYLEPKPESGAALTDLLSGEWAFCDHQVLAQAASIRFDAGGRYALLADDGSEVGVGSSTPLGPVAMMLRDDASGEEYALEGVMAFAAPRKLWLSLYDWARDVREQVVLSAQ